MTSLNYSNFSKLLEIVTWTHSCTYRSVSVAHVFSFVFPVPYASTYLNTKAKIVFISEHQFFVLILIFYPFLSLLVIPINQWHTFDIDFQFKLCFLFTLSLFFCLSLCINMYQCVCLSSVHFNIAVHVTWSNHTYKGLKTMYINVWQDKVWWFYFK